MTIDLSNTKAVDAKVRELVHAFDTEPATGAFTADGHTPSFMTKTDNLSTDSSNAENSPVFDQAVQGLEDLLHRTTDAGEITHYVDTHFFNRSMYVKGEAAEPAARKHLAEALVREFTPASPPAPAADHPDAPAPK